LKHFLLLTLVALAAAAFSNEPDEAFTDLIDAFYDGDACGVEDGLSSNSINMIDMMLMMIKMQPDEAAAEISEELQIAVTGEDLVNWTSTDFIDVLINSPYVIDEIPPRGDIDVTGFDIRGDSGIVYLKVAEYTEVFEISMVREGNDWKLDEGLLNSEL
jgi:hypothetical protein